MKTKVRFYYPYAGLPDVCVARVVIDHNAGTRRKTYESTNDPGNPYNYDVIFPPGSHTVELYCFKTGRGVRKAVVYYKPGAVYVKSLLGRHIVSTEPI